MHVGKSAFEVRPRAVVRDPCLLVRCKVAQVDQQKAIEHEQPHEQESEGDVVATGHDDEIGTTRSDDRPCIHVMIVTRSLGRK